MDAKAISNGMAIQRFLKGKQGLNASIVYDVRARHRRPRPTRGCSARRLARACGSARAPICPDHRRRPQRPGLRLLPGRGRAQGAMLERRDVVGGAAVTEEFHPGFRNSVASYTVSLLQPKVIADLRLAEHGLRVVERPIANFLPLPDGRSFRLGGERTTTRSRRSRRATRRACPTTTRCWTASPRCCAN
jgi:hypothetical protein